MHHPLQAWRQLLEAADDDVLAHVLVRGGVLCEHKQLPPGAAGLAAVHAAPQSALRTRVEPERLLGPERDRVAALDLVLEDERVQHVPRLDRRAVEAQLGVHVVGRHAKGHREAAQPPLHPLLDRRKVEDVGIMEEAHGTAVHDLIRSSHEVGLGRREGLASVAERPRLDDLLAPPVGLAQPHHASHPVLRPDRVVTGPLEIHAQLEDEHVRQQVEVAGPRACGRVPLAMVARLGVSAAGVRHEARH
mmetsp:Transcript_13580/g.32219  ORF Transcript_13580/g.32219 Transcript_13580/m.32219 type:complete len:247 (+) Transcript_13580:337-1077(+)